MEMHNNKLGSFCFQVGFAIISFDGDENFLNELLSVLISRARQRIYKSKANFLCFTFQEIPLTMFLQ